MKITLTKTDKILMGVTVCLYILGLVLGGWNIIINLVFISFILSLLGRSQKQGKMPTFYLIVLMIFIGLNILIKIGFFLDDFNNYSIKKKFEEQIVKNDDISALPTTTQELKMADDNIVWKTYINNDYGFSFKYPSQFEVEVKKSFQSKNLDNKNEITRYDFIFTTGKIVNSGTDFSGFTISVEPTNDKTILQVFGKDSMGKAFDSKYFYPIKQKGGADEAFIANGLMVYRVNNLFYWSTPFQNSRVLPDGSDDINQFRTWIFDTITFK